MSYADRIKETSTTTGTGAIALAGAVTGFKTFASRLAIGDRVAYCIEGQTPGEWEIGIGTLSGSTTLSRTYVSASSNSDTLVSFSAGTKNVFVTATASQLRDGLVDPTDVGYDIVLVAGQSNICGRDDLDALIDVADPRVMQFGGWSSGGATRYRKIFSGNDPLYHREGGTDNVGPGSWFGRVYASMIPGSRRVLLVPCGEGGTTLVHGTPGWASGTPGGALFANAVTQANLAITAALAKFPTSRFVGTIWIQGESDGDNSVAQATYVTALKALIAGFRTQITGASNSFFVIGGMCPEVIASFAGYPAIRDAHIQTAAEVDRCTYVVGPTGQRLDTWHYTAEGSRIIGINMALASRTAQQYTASDVIAPTAASAAVSNTTPTVVAITMTEAMDTGFVPAANAFTVSGHTVSSVGIVGSTINLTVTAGFVNGEAARTAAYTQPGANDARDIAGNLLANFSGLAITNNVIGAATGVTMTGPTGGVELVASTNFTLGVTPVSGTITGTLVVTPADGGSGGTFTPTTVNLTTGTPTGTFTYTPASTGAKTISVTNNGGLTNPSNITYTATSADVTAPVFSSAQVADAAPSDIVITFDETLAASTPPTSAFAASGGKTVTGTARSGATVTVTVNTPYAYGDTITVTYTAPGSDPRVQDASANITTSFGPSSVTNNIAPPASYATWNSADKSAALTLSNGDKTITGTTQTDNDWCAARSTISKTSGKWYWEVTVGVGVHVIGIGVAGDSLANFPGFSANGVGYYSAASIFKNNTHIGTGSTAAYTAGDVIGVAYNADNETVGFTKNGVQVSTTAMYAVPAGTLFAVNASRETGPAATTTTNFGASAFAHTPPTGHVGLA